MSGLRAGSSGNPSLAPMTRIRKVIIGVLAVAALGLGGAALAGATSGGDEGSGPVPQAARAAALKATGGGTTGEAERDGAKGATYEVEVKKPDGTQVDVRLGADLSVIAIDGDGDGASEQSDGD